jgi:polar amino acid transport system substrate-binding protein
MNKYRYSRALCALALFIVGTVAYAQVDSRTAQYPPGIEAPLRVGVAGNEPFVFADVEKPHGIAIDIWQDLASEHDWAYDYKTFDTVQSALLALLNGELDLVVGPISITSDRVAQMSFSQPYYQSSIAIVSRVDSKGIWSRIAPFFSLKLFVAIAVLICILAVVGTLLWLAERKESPEQFPQDPIRGVGSGMWLAIVTMSTTGYGDMAPTTVKGRVIAAVWMVVSIIFATSMVAGIASSLTLSGLDTSIIKNADELNRRKAATIAGSPVLEFLQEYKAIIVQDDNLSEAITALENRQVDAVVYDRPQLMYYLKEAANAELYLAKAEYDKQGYGFAFPLGSNLVYHVNRTLLELAEDKKVQAIIEVYLGDENAG